MRDGDDVPRVVCFVVLLFCSPVLLGGEGLGLGRVAGILVPIFEAF